MKSKKITILIPTYNRHSYLKNNLILLAKTIKKLKAQKSIRILVSDNASPDDTALMCQKFKKNNPDISFNYYIQKTNIGLEKNALFTLQKATTDFCMYLGDDDFIDENYLGKLLEIINDDADVGCVIPAFKHINPDGTPKLRRGIQTGRDLNEKGGKFPKGAKTAFHLMMKGHQLSGLLLKREGLLNAYLAGKRPNIYLFIFFTGYCSLNGNVYHITQFPVKVTEGEKKYWGYGKDGLLNEIFKNTHMLFRSNYFYRVVAESCILAQQDWRYFMYFRENPFKGIHALFHIEFASDLSIGGKLAFPLVLLIRTVFTINKKVVRKFRKNI